LQSPIFCAFPNFFCLQNFVSNIEQKQKSCPSKSVLSPQTLKPGYGPGETSVDFEKTCLFSTAVETKPKQKDKIAK